MGWEFRPLEKLAVALSVDYDARVRTDGLLVQALVLNLGLRAYLDFHKKPRRPSTASRRDSDRKQRTPATDPAAEEEAALPLPD
ncbi:MAG: hypothetical protein U0168_25355 [Nannocystaceae bacterium]